MERLLTIDDVAALLQVKKSTIYSLVHQKRIPFFKLSRKLLRFEEAEIQQWMERSRVSPVAESQKREKVQMKKKAQREDWYIERIIEKAREDVLKETRKLSWTLMLSYAGYAAACKSMIRKGGI